MSVDASQIGQSATFEQAPSTAGQVAPPQVERVYGNAPEVAQPVQQSQPAPEPAQVVAPEAPSSPPESDYRAQLEQERQLRQQQERENQQFRSTFQQIQSYAQQQQATQQEQQELRMMLAQAENMGTAEANQFLANQIALRDARKNQQFQQTLQQKEQEAQQQVRAIAAPQYADHLIQSLGLSPDAKQELLNLGDPDLMYRQAPVIKARYDQWEREKASFSQNQQQLARSQEVSALQQVGLAQVGGANGGGTWQMEVSDDPDVAALQILNAQRERDAQMRR